MSKRFRSCRWLLSAPVVGAVLFGAAGWQQAAVAAQSSPRAHPAHAPHWSYEGASAVPAP
jgi:hypothetical protein